MANFYGSGRTNYVRVQNLASLREKLRVTSISLEEHPENPAYVTFVTHSDSGIFDWSCTAELPEGWYGGKQLSELDLSKDIAPHLCQGEVLIVFEVGAEKLRYIVGVATAVAWDGRVCQVDLNSVYTHAAEVFGVDLNTIALAEYTQLPLAAAASSVPAPTSSGLDLSRENLLKLRQHAAASLESAGSSTRIPGFPSYTEYVLAMADEILRLREGKA